MEQTTNNTELNMTDKINDEWINIDDTDDEVVNNSDNTTKNEINDEVVNDIENKEDSENNVQLQHEEVVNEINNTTNTDNNFQEEKLTKTKTKTKAKAKPKTQHDTYAKFTKAEMKELADINNQIPNLTDKITKELLKATKTHIKVNDQIINVKDSNYIII